MHLSLVTNVPMEIINELNKILFGIETTPKLNTPPYVTNMKMVA